MNRLFLLGMTLVFALMFCPAAAVGDNIQNSRMVPTGKVAVFEDGEKIAEYTREMPVPEGALLSCSGRCLIKMDDIALVGEDGSRFAIDSAHGNRYLTVQEGTVYFGLSAMPMPIVFLTPKGAVAADQVILNASSGINMLEGYIMVTENTSEIGVIDGGSMHIQTNDGRKLLPPGHRFLLAQADMGTLPGNPPPKPACPCPLGKLCPKPAVAGGGFCGGEILGGIAVGGGIVAGILLPKDDDDKDGSPSSP